MGSKLDNTVEAWVKGDATYQDAMDAVSYPTRSIERKGSTSMPTAKVGSTVFSGAVSVLVIGLLNEYYLPTPIEGDMAAALTTVITFAIAYLVPDRTTQGEDVFK
jgi:hypothetical protein